MSKSSSSRQQRELNSDCHTAHTAEHQTPEQQKGKGTSRGFPWLLMQMQMHALQQFALGRAACISIHICAALSLSL